MADGEPTPDGTENFVVHETDGKSTAEGEGSMGSEPTPEPEPAPEPEPEGDDDDTDTSEGSDGDGEAEGGADDSASGASDADEGDSDEDDVEGDDDAADDDDASDGEPKKKVSAKKRIGQLTKARRAAERDAAAKEAENAALLARLDALEKKLTLADDGGKDSDAGESNAAEDEGKPDPEKFTYGELDPKYQDALLEWKLDKRDAKRKAEQETTQREKAEQQAVAKFNTDYENKVADGAEAYNDFEEVVVKGAGDQAKGIAPKYDLTQEFALMAMDSPVGHHVVYEVASNPEFSKKLAKMTPLQQAQEFGRLAAHYTSKDASPKKKKKATSAMPPPTSKVNGSGVHKKAVKDMSFAEFEKTANAELEQQ